MVISGSGSPGRRVPSPDRGVPPSYAECWGSREGGIFCDFGVVVWVLIVSFVG